MTVESFWKTPAPLLSVAMEKNVSPLSLNVLIKVIHSSLAFIFPLRDCTSCRWMSSLRAIRRIICKYSWVEAQWGDKMVVCHSTVLGARSSQCERVDLWMPIAQSGGIVNLGTLMAWKEWRWKKMNTCEIVIPGSEPFLLNFTFVTVQAFNAAYHHLAWINSCVS